MEKAQADNELPMCEHCNRRRMVRHVVTAGYDMTYNGCDCTLRGMFYERMNELAQMGMVRAHALGHVLIPVSEEEQEIHQAVSSAYAADNVVDAEGIDLNAANDAYRRLMALNPAELAVALKAVANSHAPQPSVGESDGPPEAGDQS